MEQSENKYEIARLKQIAVNKAKLQSLGVFSAAEAVAAPGQARRRKTTDATRGKHARSFTVTTPVPRRTTGRAAAVRASSKLREQQVDSGSSGAASASDEERSPSHSVDTGDIDSDSSLCTVASRDKNISSPHPSRRTQLGATQDRRSTASSNPTCSVELYNDSDDEELQRALQLSLGEAAEVPIQFSHAVSAPAAAAAAAHSGGQAPPSGSVVPHCSSCSDSRGNPQQATGVSQPDARSHTNVVDGNTARKKGKGSKPARGAPVPPTDEELTAVFRMLNRKNLSAIISSDIQQVASDVLLIEHEPEQLQNMMVRACELLGTQQARIDPEGFHKLARHYLG